jgi:hypothetical protein
MLGESKDRPGPGRTIIDNSATKIILKQSENTAVVVAQAFNLRIERGMLLLNSSLARES